MSIFIESMILHTCLSISSLGMVRLPATGASASYSALTSSSVGAFFEHPATMIMVSVASAKRTLFISYPFINLGRVDRLKSPQPKLFILFQFS